MRPLRRAGAVLAATVLIAAGCGGGDDGDVEAYCGLVDEGVGLGASSIAAQEAELQLLLDVAPGEIREAVLELSNTTRRLDDIEELDQLFDAVFDPEAQAAKDAFDEYAFEVCGLDQDELGATSGDLIAEVRAYAIENFEGASWVPKVRYDVEREAASVTGVTATFIVDPADDEATQVCTALSVYLYELRDSDGPVVVMSDGDVIVRRDGPDGRCERG